MTDKTNFDIPESIKEMAEQSLDQSKDAYNQFMDASRKAHELFTHSSEAMTAGAKKVQMRAVEYAEENMKAGFSLAEQLVKARDLQEALEIQSKFARRQMENYSLQAQELTRLVGEAAKKSQP